MSEIAFVAGATGYTGREVVAHLVARGIETHAHVRPDSSRRDHWSAHFAELGAHVDLSPWDAESMTDTFGRLRPTLVFALLGTTRARSKAAASKGEEAGYLKIDYGLTRILIDAAATLEAPPRFVYLSSLGVTETTTNAYLRARHLAETDLRKSGLPWTIARPSFITGPDREESRPGERVAAAIADVSLGVLGKLGASKLASRYASTDAHQLAGALVHFATHSDGLDKLLLSEDLQR